MNLLFCVNQKHLEHLIPLVTSLMINSKKNTNEYDIYILSSEELDLKRFDKLVEFFGFRISYKKVDMEEYKSFTLFNDKFSNGHLSIEAYYRLLCCYFIPQDIERILYLDSDIIVEGDISFLENFDMNGCVFGASRSAVKDFNNYVFLEVQSGVMLFDTKKMRDENIAELIKKISKKVTMSERDKHPNFNNDQEILHLMSLIPNIVCELPISLNTTDWVASRDYPTGNHRISSLDDDVELKNILGEYPIIYHYAGKEQKAWNFKNSRYYKYLEIYNSINDKEDLVKKTLLPNFNMEKLKEKRLANNNLGNNVQIWPGEKNRSISDKKLEKKILDQIKNTKELVKK